MPNARLNIRLLSAGPFVTMIDRFAVAPVLIPIAADFHAPVGAVAIAATAYYLAYGLAQPFWGFASDRAGRIRIIRISLAATSAACTLSALAPNLAVEVLHSHQFAVPHRVEQRSPFGIAPLEVIAGP